MFLHFCDIQQSFGEITSSLQCIHSPYNTKNHHFGLFGFHFSLAFIMALQWQRSKRLSLFVLQAGLQWQRSKRLSLCLYCRLDYSGREASHGVSVCCRQDYSGREASHGVSVCVAGRTTVAEKPVMESVFVLQAGLQWQRSQSWSQCLCCRQDYSGREASHGVSVCCRQDYSGREASHAVSVCVAGRTTVAEKPVMQSVFVLQEGLACLPAYRLGTVGTS